MRQAEAIAATATNIVAMDATQRVFSRVKREADRVMWVSTLDHRTSDFCKVADGKVFPIDSGPRPPAHLRCRSNVIVLAFNELINELTEINHPSVRQAIEG